MVRTFHDLKDQLAFRDQAVVHPPSRQTLRREEESVGSPQPPALQRPYRRRPRSVRMMLDYGRAIWGKGVPQGSQLQRVEQAIHMNRGLNRSRGLTGRANSAHGRVERTGNLPLAQGRMAGIRAKAKTDAAVPKV